MRLYLRLAAASMLTIVLASGDAGAQTAPDAIKAPAPPQQSPGLPAPAGMQFLYGSAEAAANARTIWRGLVEFVRTHRRKPRSVVLADGSTLEGPRWTVCGKKPLAAVFDVDETVLLNAGFEYDAARGTPYSDARWQQWEYYAIGKPVPTPGAVEALAALRAMNVRVIFNTNRLIAFADQNQQTIERAKLGPARYEADPARWASQTLYLAAGTDPEQRKKDGRRTAIAEHYCVIAMGGDQLGDFSDLFGTIAKPQPRREAADKPGIADLWGAGWFVFPNPVYGSALKGTVNDIFAESVRWPDPVEETK